MASSDPQLINATIKALGSMCCNPGITRRVHCALLHASELMNRRHMPDTRQRQLIDASLTLMDAASHASKTTVNLAVWFLAVQQFISHAIELRVRPCGETAPSVDLYCSCPRYLVVCVPCLVCTSQLPWSSSRCAQLSGTCVSCVSCAFLTFLQGPRAVF